MALQGDLSSFALADVLRLLGNAGKSGRLIVTGEADHGELWLRDGGLAGGSASSRPSASSPSDVIHEIHRFDGGTFAFDDTEQVVEGASQSIDEALGIAEGLQAEWDAVTAVVPTMEHWIVMAPELPEGTESITVSAERWQILAGLGEGSSVRALTDRLEVSDLEGSKHVKSLVEEGFVVVDEPRTLPDDTWQGYRTDEPAATVAEETLDDDEIFVVGGAATPEAELVRLGAEDGPLVIETSDDALLPEPLPGEGTSFTSDSDAFSGETDGFGGDPEIFATASDPVIDGSDGSVDHPEPGPISTAFAPVDTPVGRELDEVDHENPDLGDRDPVAADADDPYASVDTGGIWSGPGDASDIGTDEDAFDRVGWDTSKPPVDHLNGGQHEDGSDRTSLLKFLSNVKS